MKRSSISPGAWFVFGIVGILVPPDTFAQNRVVVEPSVEIVGIHDDNLFFSDDERPASDFIQRVRPALHLRFHSPRWTADGSYGLDSERFATHSTLNNARARERASVTVGYRSSPRLTFGIEGAYTNTDTPAELNLDTGLGASRMRASRISFRPSARFMISPRLTARAAASSSRDRISTGGGMEAQVQSLAIERQMTSRDLFTLAYDQAFYVFDHETSTSRTTSYLLQAGWTRDLDARTRLVLMAGPRLINGSTTAELSASLTHDWRYSSITISGLQTQTTVVGHGATVETQNLQATFAYSPIRSLSAYAAPAILRSVSGDLDATVYRISLGARYSLTPSAGLDIHYSNDMQRGMIDPLRADSELSHSMLSIGFTTRWNSPSGIGTRR